MISSAVIRDQALDPVLDARAANIVQQKLLHQPETTAADSLIELLTVGLKAIDKALGLVDQVDVANRVEGDRECHVAGWADELVTKLRDDELNGSEADRIMSGRQLANRLKEGLDRWEAADNPVSKALAIRPVISLLDRLPHQMIFRDAVTYHLGLHRTEVLRELCSSVGSES